MNRLVRIVVWLALLAGVTLPAMPAQAQSLPVPGACVQGKLPEGALTLVCIPTSGWNHDLIVFAHGYTAFNQPLGFENLTLPDGTSLPLLSQRLGFAFATTSYRVNGLAILPGENDIRELVSAFRRTVGVPRHTYLVGGSEGGLIATLLVEQSPQLFSGGLAACGPIGNFRLQLDFIGDFIVLFDYFFPGVIPGSPLHIPPQVIANWDQVYAPAVLRALQANPAAAAQLIATSKAVIDPANPATIAVTTLGLLWYDIFATNDAIAKLGGNPYDNRDHWYWGSNNDLLLNLTIPRYSASPVALAHLAPYETTGKVTLPLVTLHTTGDNIIPFWHELLYAAKAHPAGRGSLVQIPSVAYGHCNFNASDLLGAFGLLVLQVSGQQLPNVPAVTVHQAQRDFAPLRQHVVLPR